MSDKVVLEGADFLASRTYKPTLIFIALAAGGGVIVGIASAYFYLGRRRKNTSITLADMALINQELESIRRELAKLKEAVERLVPAEAVEVENVQMTKNRRKKAKKDLKALSKSTLSSLSQASSDAFFDAPSSLSETSSAKSDEESILQKQQQKPENLANGEVASTDNDGETGGSSVVVTTLDNLPKVISLVDRLQTKGSDEARLQAYTLMQNNYAVGKSNSDFLWRFAMACYLFGQTFLNKNQNKRKTLCEEARKFAFEALALNENDADVHKWCALTLGIMSDFVGMKQKIEDGHHFKLHIDRALLLKPQDPVLHHLKGRWCYGVAGLTWFERKVATTLFAKPPDSTFMDALKCFLEADRLKPKWLENMLYIVKVYQATNDRENIREMVLQARQIKAVSSDDSASKREMEEILSRL